MDRAARIVFAVLWAAGAILWVWIFFNVVTIYFFHEVPSFSGTSLGLFLVVLWAIIGPMHIQFYRLTIRLLTN